MAKTFTNIASFTSGQILTAAQMNEIGTTLNNNTVPPAVRIARTTAQSIPDATWTIVNSYAETFDTDGMWTAANDYIEIQTAGMYLVSCSGGFITNATGNRIGTITRNSVDIFQSSAVGQGLWYGVVGGSLLVNLAALDKIRFQVYQTRGVALDLGADASTYGAMSAVFVGKTA